jgi:hypothetical protein
MSISNGLCIIPCGSSKVWDAKPGAGPQKAENVYTGVFTSTCQKYARTNFDHWVILSAKHGFLHPHDIISGPYNVSFIKPSSEEISMQELDKQAIEKGLINFNEITVLGGKHYVERVVAIFNQGHTIHLPLRDCKGIGYMLQRLTQALEIRATLTANSKARTSGMSIKLSSEPTLFGKYTPLYNYLRTIRESTVKLSIQQIEGIVGFELPASSIKHRAWWSNDISHSQAKAWLHADWEVQEVKLPYITLRRIHDSGR